MKIFQRINVLLIILFSISFIGAQGLKSLKVPTLKKPKVSYDHFEVKKVGFKETEVEFIYKVKNPNSIGLDFIYVDYELYLKETKAVSGENMKFKLKAKATTDLVLPATINYSDFFKSTEKLTKAILAGEKTIPFKMVTVFKVDLKLLKFKIPVETEGELPLPKLKKKLF